MCGFAGYFVEQNEESLGRNLSEAGKLLHHRGPDFSGTFQDTYCGCAHARLSIVDLSAAGNQPFADGRYLLAYNGEIYNHQALRAELLRQDARIQFRGSSDTATLFACLCRFGVPATLERIRGMFAFAFVDRQDKRLFLCRDRFGIKPLLWASVPGGVVWASEAKALGPLTRLEPDPVKALYGLFGVADHSWEQTVFRGVCQVPPGQFLECRLGGQPQFHTYYTLAGQVSAAYHHELRRMSRRDVVDRFTALLKASTQSMLMSDAPMGAFVSGGIDSSLVASLASPLLSNFQLFTADVIGPYSEYKDACQLAQHLRRDLQPAHFQPAQMIQDWASATWHYEMPIVTHTNSIPFASVARVARNCGVKAILSGEGSDELFLGYPWLLTRRYDRLLKLPLDAVRSIYRLVPKLASYVGEGDKLQSFSSQMVRNFEHQLLRERARPAFDFLSRKPGDEQFLTVQMFGDHLSSLLHRNDRMGMSASIEARFPFLDEEVVRFALNLPVKWKIGRTWQFHNYKHPFLQDKAIVRAAASDLLPKQLVQKRKLGFPMLGHKFTTAKPDCFYRGYVAELLGLKAPAIEYMIRTQPKYFVAKLVSLEVFGRIFALHQDLNTVTDHLQRTTQVEVSGHS